MDAADNRAPRPGRTQRVDSAMAEPLGAAHRRRGLAAEAQRIAAVIPTKVIAAAVSASSRTVRTWLTGASTPTGQRARRLAALGAVTERLTHIIDADYIPVWMVKPIVALDDHTPAEMIAAGDGRRVLQLISSLEAPGAA